MSRNPEDRGPVRKTGDAGMSEKPGNAGMKCYIVRDLLPDYEDGLVSQEVTKEIENHLRTCEDCQAYRKALMTSRDADQNNQSISDRKAGDRKSCDREAGNEKAGDRENVDRESGETDAEFLRQMRRKIRLKYVKSVIAGAAIIVAVIICLCFIRVVRPYDRKNMTAETYQLALMENTYGNNQWTDLDQLDFKTTEAVLKGKNRAIDFVRVVRQNGSNTEKIDSIGRTITQDGKKVRIIFYCYWDSIWDDMTAEDGKTAGRWESNASIEDGEELYQTDHETEERKIYYLPKANLSRYEKLSDEEFEQLAEDAVLVWDGNV